MNQMPPQLPATGKSVGPIIGIIIIIVVLIIGALYFYGGRLNRQTVPVAPETGQEIQANPLSASDSIEDIATDLRTTVINSTDADIGKIQAQINQ